MLQIFFSSFVIILLFSPFGIFFSNREKSISSFSSQLIYSSIVISFIALFLNFFIPLSLYVNSFLILFALYFIFKDWNLYFSKNYLIFLLLTSSIIFLLITNSHTYRPDSGLYHFPYINILNNEKIILGIANLHFRFGHISIIQYLSAISNNLILGINGMVLPSALIASAVIVNFSGHFFLYIKKNELNFHFYFVFASIIYIFYKMNRYGEYGNDAPSHFLFFFLVSEIIRSLQEDNIKKIANFFLLSTFIILNKITLLFSIFLPLILINKKNFFEIFKEKKIYFSLIFLVLWLIKNLLVSGCLVYPVKKTCLGHVEWTDLKKVEYVSNENEAWTKNWPSFRKNNPENLNHKNYIKNFNWVETWIKNYSINIIKILLPYIIFLLLIYLVLRNNNFKKNTQIKVIKINLLLIILLISSIFWFLKVPVYRYGYSYLISFIAVIFSYQCSIFSIKANIYKFFYFLFIILAFVFFLKNGQRILVNNIKYNNSPWPKYYSHSENNLPPILKSKIINGKKIYMAPNGYCMYSKAPCSNLDINIQVKRKYGYLIFLRLLKN